MVKHIFLDIDGVLVTRRIATFEEPLLRNLKRLVDETGAKIVLSSDWRRHPQARAEAKRVLATVGLSFIAWTPCLSAFIAQRPTEIMQWKKEYSKQPNQERVSHWVAIDDRALLEERHGTHLQGHFCHTNVLRGLVDEKVEECKMILNQEVGSAGDIAEDVGFGALERDGGHMGLSLPQPRGPAAARSPAAQMAKRGASTGPMRSPQMTGAGAGPTRLDMMDSAASAAAAQSALARPRGRSVSNPPGAYAANAAPKRAPPGAGAAAGRGRGTGR